MKVSCMALILLVFLSACSSTSRRAPASLMPNTCSIEKNPQEPTFYRVLVNGKPWQQKWMGDRDATRTLRRLEMQGQCDILN